MNRNSFLSVRMFFLMSIFSFNSMSYGKTGDSLKVTVKTATYNGDYSPANSLMMWIQKDNQFVKTILKKAEKRIRYCTKWASISKNDVDGLTGATRDDHTDSLVAIWDCTDQNGAAVANGTYQFWVEMTEDNATGKSSYGTVTIDDDGKTVEGQTTKEFPVFKAIYVVPVSTKKPISNPENRIGVSKCRNTITFDLPGSGKYSLLMISAEGKLIAERNGTGSKASLSTDNVKLKAGVYLIKISQAGKNQIFQHLAGF